MKRIFAIIAAVALCFVLTIPAFAVDYNGIELPSADMVWTDRTTYPVAVMLDSDILGLTLILSSAQDSRSSDGDYSFVGPYVMYCYSTSKNEWLFSLANDSSEQMHLDCLSYIWASESIVDENGNVIFASSVSDTGTAATLVLPTSIPTESLSGALGEVTSMLAVALPVVAGLFGIRKGIAFLLSRVRGA